MNQTDRRLNTQYAFLQCSYWIDYLIIASFAAVILSGRGFSASQIGYVTTVGAVLTIILQTTLSDLADRSERVTVRQIIIALLLGGAAVGLIMWLIPKSFAVAFICMFTALSLANSLSPLLVSICLQYNAAGHDINFGIARSVGSLAYSIFCAVFGTIVDHLGINVMPAASELSCLLLIASLAFTGYFFRKGKALQGKAKNGEPASGGKQEGGRTSEGTAEEIVEEAAAEEVPEQVVTSEDEIPEETIVAEASVAAANAPGKVSASEEEPPTIQTGWVKDGDQYRYFGEDGIALTGWQTIGDYSYYFDPDTQARVTGIQEIDGKLYVFSVLGRQYRGPKFVKTAAGNCFVNSDGTLLKGWRKYYGDWYYFQDNGLMKTGKLILNGKTYFLNQDGIRQTGWYKTKLYTYYLNKDGAAVTGWRTIGGKRYFFTHNGVMKTGWYKTSGHIYYLGPKGNQLTGFRTIGGDKYYLIKDGTVTKGWRRISRKWYYFKSCKAQTGWLQLGSKRYYLDKNGVMVTGKKTIDGVVYRFNSQGVLIPSTNNYHNTEEFIACIAPLVQKYAPKYGVKVCSPIIAQAILESASGESSLGKKYNNFFGLKCGTLWTGPRVDLLTGEEYTAGHYTTITAAFRVYSNMEEGVKGYFEFLFRNRTRYNNLIGETDPYRYLEKIKADGYATSSHYVVNTYNVLKRYNLTRFDKK